MVAPSELSEANITKHSEIYHRKQYLDDISIRYSDRHLLHVSHLSHLSDLEVAS